MIVPDFHNDQTWQQPKEDHLDRPYLLFTSNLDGDIDTYLDELCKELAPRRQEIWGRCIGCPERAEGPALKKYLLHNQIKTRLLLRRLRPRDGRARSGARSPSASG